MADPFLEWDENPYIFHPNRNLTLEEINVLLKYTIGGRLWSDEFYESLPEELQEHFIKKDEIGNNK